uniref:Uncharacterized protein n=1 Tax=Moniliophthora roreri TaxID=221103 RepID=A0A0W0FAX0_MONRR
MSSLPANNLSPSNYPNNYTHQGLFIPTSFKLLYILASEHYDNELMRASSQQQVPRERLFQMMTPTPMSPAFSEPSENTNNDLAKQLTLLKDNVPQPNTKGTDTLPLDKCALLYPELKTNIDKLL